MNARVGADEAAELPLQGRQQAPAGVEEALRLVQLQRAALAVVQVLQRGGVGDLAVWRVTRAVAVACRVDVHAKLQGPRLALALLEPVQQRGQAAQALEQRHALGRGLEQRRLLLPVLRKEGRALTRAGAGAGRGAALMRAVAVSSGSAATGVTAARAY
jgi:hypothetical protein